MCVYVRLSSVYVCTGGKVLLQWEKSYRVYGVKNGRCENVLHWGISNMIMCPKQMRSTLLTNQLPV